MGSSSSGKKAMASAIAFAPLKKPLMGISIITRAFLCIGWYIKIVLGST